MPIAESASTASHTAGVHAAAFAACIADTAFAERLLDHLTEPIMSLREVAQRMDISVLELTAFLDSPEGQFIYARAVQAAVMRTRITALAYLPSAVGAVITMLESYQSEAGRLVQDTPLSREFHERQRENARKAAHLLARFANFTARPTDPAPAKPQPTQQPTQQATQQPTYQPHPQTNPPRSPPPTTPTSAPIPTPHPRAHASTEFLALPPTTNTQTAPPTPPAASLHSG